MTENKGSSQPNKGKMGNPNQKEEECKKNDY